MKPNPSVKVRSFPGTYRRAIIAGLALAAAHTGSARAQSLVVNGSFEQGPNPGGSFILLCPSSQAIAGWTVTRDCVHYGGSYWAAGDGIRTVDLDGTNGDAGGLAQAFATTPGVTYTVDFKLAGNPVAGPAIKRMIVAAAGQQAEFTFDITGRSPANMGWVDRTWAFVANAQTTTIEFYSVTSPPGFGPVIDHIRVTAPAACSPDLNCDGNADQDDVACLIAAIAGNPGCQCQDLDFNRDGNVDQDDVAALINVVAGGNCP